MLRNGSDLNTLISLNVVVEIIQNLFAYMEFNNFTHLQVKMSVFAKEQCEKMIVMLCSVFMVIDIPLAIFASTKSNDILYVPWHF